jgi:hypothetical protein
MVKGLEVFREHFRDYADRYLLIGGAACDLAMSAAALPFRATKDLAIRPNPLEAPVTTMTFFMACSLRLI